MAQFLNDKVPGITVPPALMDRIANADDVTEEAINIAADTIKQLEGLADGVHIMAIGWEDHVRPSSKPQVFKPGELAIAEPRRAALVSHQRANATKQTATFAP